VKATLKHAMRITSLDVLNELVGDATEPGRVYTVRETVTMNPDRDITMVHKTVHLDKRCILNVVYYSP